ncbi:MAG: hypothetical protein J6V88_02045, partial [Kiritimatiellae bacterium]|nr:hypothetical protein [Kiritimatiellia bacterium]
SPFQSSARCRFSSKREDCACSGRAVGAKNVDMVTDTIFSVERCGRECKHCFACRSTVGGTESTFLQALKMAA